MTKELLLDIYRLIYYGYNFNEDLDDERHEILRKLRLLLPAKETDRFDQ